MAHIGSTTLLDNNTPRCQLNQRFILFTLACFAYLKPCLIFFQLGDTHEVSQLLLAKGQETQLSSKQEVKIAEHILLLSTLKLGIASALSLGQLIAETQCILDTSKRFD